MKVNIYDFDGTIYDGDSTLDFYMFCLKKNIKIFILLPKQLFYIFLYKINIKNKNQMKEVFFSFLNYIDNIDFMPLNINKGKGVTILADRYHIAKDDIIVIGDDRNDIAMFKVAGKSYAMAHSDIDIKKYVDDEVDLIEEAIYRELRG